VEADFDGGRLTSDAGLLVLREVDQRLGLIDAVNQAIPDPRDPRYVIHHQRELLAQRIFAIAAGYEDENDHGQLRYDPALQVASEREPDEDQPLGSPSTLCRLENRVSRQTIARLHQVLVDQFLASYDSPPGEIVLDLDATDDPLHGAQEGRFFHGYYKCYCYLPLYVFCGSHLLVALLRPSNIDAAKHSRAVVRLLVRAIRQQWPQTRIILRGDSGFCRWRLMRWCEKNRVDYIFGLARNRRLQEAMEPLMREAETAFEASGQKVRRFAWLDYGARSWDRGRRVIAKAERLSKGRNPRFVVTTLQGDPQELYETTYCARGEMENRIKEQQLMLFADRTSCSAMLANQFRLLLSGLAYTLLDGLRRIALAGTEMCVAQCDTLRLKLIKVAARVRITARRVVFHLASSSPAEPLLRHALAALNDSS
jgi:hypothetical protein